MTAIDESSEDDALRGLSPTKMNRGARVVVCIGRRTLRATS